MELQHISLLIPLITIVSGIAFRFGLPRKVNWVAGYRTPMACKNQDTWAFAHMYCGKLFIILGLVMLVVSIGAMVSIDMEAYPERFGVVVITQLVAFLLPLVLTEMALRKEFDKDGNKK